ncbi:RNase adapter RapZ [Novispirillum sp. DQ9]|uniref:RNase adapter RapZ n=1 Tax=Novispirillum sp. DQ9 TaxID=3398612 RepID=UPI003C7CA2C2
MSITHERAGAPAGHAGTQGAGRLVVVTGMSGAGKTMALKVFEDIGYEAVDNLPLVLLDGLVGGTAGGPGGGPGGSGMRRPIAIGIDIRTRDFDVPRLLGTIDALARDRHLDVEVLFLDADDEILARRYTETRRRHPIGGDLPLPDGIALERRLLAALRDRAEVVVDTTRLPAGGLKQMLETRYATAASPGMCVFVTSFGFRNGLPREADLVLDVRFLRNPHYVPDLKPLTGRDPAVAEYVAADPDYDSFFAHATALLGPLLPRYEVEGKSYLTVAIGCTGGRHRSVFVAERLGAWVRAQGRRATVCHRDTPVAPGGAGAAILEEDAPMARQETTGGPR